MVKRVTLHDRWVGWHRPAFDRDPPRLEPWAVYVFEIPGAARAWYVVGRLLQRPWTRVGGGGEHLPGQSTAQAREWLARQKPKQANVWFPVGSLLIPSEATAADLRPWRPEPTHWAPRHTFNSLDAAREAAQRMANTLCPHDQTRLTWPGRKPSPTDGSALSPAAGEGTPGWLVLFRGTLAQLPRSPR